MGSGSSLGKRKCRWAGEPVQNKSCARIQEAETPFSVRISKREPTTLAEGEQRKLLQIQPDLNLSNPWVVQVL